MTTYQSTSPASNHQASEPGDSPSLVDILAPVAPEIALVEEYLVTNLIDDTVFIGELLSQIFQAGGKRIRPAITLLCSKATAKEQDSELSRLHIILAVLTELIHTASLVHDDVIDKATLRRGQETINKKWNERLAVLMGDLLFAQASVCLSRIMNPIVVGIYGQVLGDLCSGEIRQMQQQFSTSINFDSYIRKSIGKTASLFGACSHSGAILNGANDEVVESLKQYGLNLGLCFQIVDDLLDVSGTSFELGKQAGSDLSGGVITAPALFVLERGDAVAKRLETLIKTRAVATVEGTQEALTLIKENGGIEKTVDICRHYARLGKECLLVLPESDCKDSLESLIDYVVTRKK
jgi:all-trans-nonaprenyl-diphosphate synthase